MPDLPRPLTGREQTILERMAQGDNIKETATALGVAEKTIVNTRRLLYAKLRARSAAHAVAVGVDLGLLPTRAHSSSVGAGV